MNQDKYRNCMRKYMSGEGKSKEERQHDICIGAKICSGKAKTQDEAEYLCSLPREVKPQKQKSDKSGDACEKEVLKLAHCIAERIDMDLASNINSIEMAIVNAMTECKCGNR